MQKRRGISLIVLVITIIVMIVLAGAIILSLNNAGIIERANEAVKSTDEATVKELAKMAWAEAYADGVRKVETEGNVKGFQDRVTEALEVNGIEPNKYIIAVTTKGVDVKEKTNAWIQDGLKVVRGKEELTIGQTVNYNAGVEGYTGGWKVLGADEIGNLLIMSAADVKTEYPLGSTTLTEAQKEWLSAGVTKLDAECKPYGKGAYAISARSIRVEDIDKVTGFDKTTYYPTAINKYGNEVTYTYNKTTKPAYKGTNNVAGDLTTDHPNGFYWYDEKGFHNVTAADLTKAENNGKEIATITSNYYSYKGVDKLSVTTDAYKMIFGAEGSYNAYWLASPFVYIYTSCVLFGMRHVYEGNAYGSILWHSAGVTLTPTGGVRAVVTLESNIPMANLVQ